MRVIRCFLVIASIFAGLSLYSQEIVFDLSAPLRVEAGGSFRIEFTMNAKPDNFTPPSFTGINIIAGPSTSQGQSISIINGKTTSEVNYTITYVLQAGDEGRITIPPAKAVVNGKTYSTRSTTIEVSAKGAGAGSGQSPSQRGQSGGESPASSSLSKDDIIVRAVVSSTDVYKGEPVKVTFKLYNRAQLTGIENPTYPAFNGFWTQSMDPQDSPWQRETYNNKVYDTKVLREYIVFPQQAGVLEVEQASFPFLAQIVTQNRRQSLLDDFFGGGVSAQQVKQTAVSQAVKITVRDLPAGAPPSFGGAVGRFTMEGGVGSTAITANSAANYEIKISGSGNLPLIEAPKVNIPSSFEQYTVKVTDNYKTSGNNISGTKQFTIPFIARAEGSYVISPVDFTYFDTSSKSYRTLTIPATTVSVSPDGSAGAATNGMVSGVNKEELKILGSDIRFIKVGDPGLKTGAKPLVWSWSYILLLAALIAAFAATIAYLNKRIKIRSNATLVKNRGAHKAARRRLRNAERSMLSGNDKLFYEEMLKALWGYISDKLDIPVADLSKTRIEGELLSRGIGEETAKGYSDAIAGCEYARYAPDAESRTDQVYKNAEELISQIESKL